MVKFHAAQINALVGLVRVARGDGLADAGHPVATYTNLAPGKYRLHLQGTNNKGVASRDEIVLPITITPPAWQTWWARSAVALLALAALLYRWGVRRLAERTDALKAARHKRPTCRPPIR